MHDTIKIMNKFTTILLSASAMFCMAGCGTTRIVYEEPPPTAAVIIKEAPPAPRVEKIYAAPSQESVWISGHWKRKGNTWDWYPGYWEAPPRRGLAWVPGHWAEHRGGWYWVEGHWKS
jgi:hypothetical protein